jgi:hypothetical protein
MSKSKLLCVKCKATGENIPAAGIIDSEPLCTMHLTNITIPGESFDRESGVMLPRVERKPSINHSAHLAGTFDISKRNGVTAPTPKEPSPSTALSVTKKSYDAVRIPATATLTVTETSLNTPSLRTPDDLLDTLDCTMRGLLDGKVHPRNAAAICNLGSVAISVMSLQYKINREKK